MAEKKRTFTACKERGSPGKRAEIVLNSNHRRMVNELDPDKLVDPMIGVGLLDPDEVDVVLRAEGKKAVTRMLSYAKRSGPDSFDKLMAALRMADYDELAADLENELENTDSPTAREPRDVDTYEELPLIRRSAASQDSSSVMNEVMCEVAKAGVGVLTSMALQKAGFGSTASSGGIGIHYGKTWGNGNIFHCSASLTPENMFQIYRAMK